MAGVASDIDAAIATDGARTRVEWVRRTEDLAASCHDVVTLPDHGADGTVHHLVDDSCEVRPRVQVSVVLLHMIATGLAEFHGTHFKAT